MGVQIVYLCSIGVVPSGNNARDGPGGVHNCLAQLQQRVGLQELGVREQLADVAGAYACHSGLQRLCLARRQLCPVAIVRALYRYQAAHKSHTQ